MKKVLSLVMILIFSLTACGGKGGGASDDPNLGKYIGEEYSSDGSSWYSIDDVLEGESYIELKDGGKACSVWAATRPTSSGRSRTAR